jgi:hypothetical protein
MPSLLLAPSEGGRSIKGKKAKRGERMTSGKCWRLVKWKGRKVFVGTLLETIKIACSRRSAAETAALRQSRLIGFRLSRTVLEASQVNFAFRGDALTAAEVRASLPRSGLVQCIVRDGSTDFFAALESCRRTTVLCAEEAQHV